MPTVALDRDELFSRLGRTFTEKEFDELCFQFGIELDEVMTEEVAQEKRHAASSTGAASRVLYYIAVPANRYDLLCMEGISRALNIFMQRVASPSYRTISPASPIHVAVAPSTHPLRPFLVAAVLRGVTFSRASYDSFIDLQDKLHNNICRKRALVAIGTHDLSTLSPPFTYACVPPAELSFVPLSQARPFRGDELLEFYRTEPSVKHIKPYLGLLGPAPAALAPLITDAAGTVLSLPPLINGEHSKITLATRDVFIECTATDLSKAHTVLNTMVTMFCEYAAEPFTVEQVRVTYAQPVTAFLGGVGGAASQLVAEQATPDLSSRHATASPAAIASLIGAPVLAADAAALLSKMGLAARAVEGAELAGAAAAAAASGLTATPLSSGDPERTLIAVTVPPTRSDVLQECDIAEDVAIAFGYNNIVRTLPATPTSGGQLPVNALTDKLRAELAAAGAQECLTLALVSREENYGAMLLKEDGRAVVLANPQSEEFQIGRTSVLPGLLKSLACNGAAAKGAGLTLFEVTDVMLLDAASDVGARNERRLAVLYTGPTGGFEVVHGLIDRVMALLEVPVRPYTWEAAAGGGGGGAGAGIDPFGKHGMRYFVEPTDATPTFFNGRGANIVLERRGGERSVVGSVGVLHPQVLKNFELSFPTSVAEITIEPFVIYHSWAPRMDVAGRWIPPAE